MGIATADIEVGVASCMACHEACGTAAFGLAREAAARAEARDLRLIAACGEVCRSSAELILTGAGLRHEACGVCADLCHRCAEAAMRIGGLDPLVEACRRCESDCLRLAA